MNHKLLFALIALATVGCNKSKPYDNVDPETLKPTGSEDTRPTYSFEKELNDDRSRFVSETLTLYYDEGGTIFSKEADNGTIIYRAIELATGNSAELYLQKTSPRLLINGDETPVKSVMTERDNEKGAWINIQTPDYKHIVFVVTDL